MNRSDNLKVLIVASSDARRGAEIKAIELGQALRAQGVAVENRALVACGAPDGARLDIDVLGRFPLGPGALRSLRALARRSDVVLAYGSTTLPACALSMFGLSTPFVYRSIGDLPSWIRGPVHRWRTRLLLGRASKVVALWPDAAAALTNVMRVPVSKCVVIADTESSGRFRPATPAGTQFARARLGLANDGPVVAIVGALTPEKRVDLAIEAVAGLADARLLVVGDGPLRPVLESSARSMLGDRATFVGVLEDVAEAYAAADVLLVTSSTEGMPGVVLEAVACGLPVVATAVGALPWMAENDPGSIELVDPDASTDAIADALRDCVREFEDRRLLPPSTFPTDHVVGQWKALLADVTRRREDRATGQRPMTVLAVMDSTAGGGTEVSMAALAPKLRDHGVSVEVAYFHDRSGAKELFESAGIPLHHVPMRGTRIATVMALRRLIVDLDPDIVHTMVFEADVIGRTAGFLARKPVISSIISDMYGEEFLRRQPSQLRARMAQAADITTARFVSRFHAVSDTVASTMSRRLFVRRSQIDVIHRGRDMTAIAARIHEPPSRADLGLPTTGPLILCVGRHEPAKDLGTAIDAMAVVLAYQPDAHLIVAGREGTSTQSLRDHSVRLDVEQSVRLLGHRLDVPELLAVADVLLFPSLWEGLPGTLIEAMAIGTPIVCSDLPVLREVTAAGGAESIVSFVSPQSSAEFGQAVVRTLSRFAGIEHRPRATARTAFDLHRAAALHAAHYRSAAT